MDEQSGDMMNGESWTTRMLGTCRSWKDTWGFLTADGVEGDIFVHVRENPNLGGGLQPGEQVEFELTSGSGANSEQAKAVNAQKLNGGGAAAYAGVVASFREGWGLIESPSLSEKLYCGLRDNPQLQNRPLIPGDQVMFDVGTNSANGKEKAINISVKRCDQSELVGCRVRGYVKSFKDGWGFAASDRFSGTIMLGKKSISASGISFLSVGAEVEFEITAAQNGKFEAAHIQGAEMPMTRGVPPASPFRDRSRSPHGNGAGRMSGTVRKFQDGWGFLISPQLTGDIYVNLQQSPNLGGMPLVPGEAVTFEPQYRATSDRNNGVGAINVQRANAAGPYGGKGAGTVAPKGGKSGKSASHVGTMSMVKEGAGWGWIKSETLGDIFFGLRDNPQISELPPMGEQLTFEIAVDQKSGRPKALNVAQSLAGQRVQGTVKSLRDGWGFATSEGIEGNVLLGKKNLQASGIDFTKLKPGDWLEYDLGTAAKGYEALTIKQL